MFSGHSGFIVSSHFIYIDLLASHPRFVSLSLYFGLTTMLCKITVVHTSTKMRTAIVLAISVLMMVSFIGRSEAIKCYDCIAQAGCNDPFDATKVTTTDCVINSCLKTKIGSTVTRSCGTGLISGCKSEDDVTACECSTDSCNGASVATFGRVVLGLSLAAVVTFGQIFGRL
jgi:hypothetical protein